MVITEPSRRKSPSIKDHDVKKIRNFNHEDCRPVAKTRAKSHQKKKTVSQSSLDVHNNSDRNRNNNNNKSNEIYSKHILHKYNEELYLCGICFDHKKRSEIFRGGCKHSFCSDCISKHAAAQIQQNNLKVYCPDYDCRVELKPKCLQLILPKEVVDRWESARCESLISVEKMTYCPYKNCSVLIVDDGGEVVTSAECPSCHRLFCAQCLVPWHAGMNCKQFKSKSKCIMSKEEVLESMFLDLAKRRMWQRCPKCKFYVQRRGGCEHMICRCGCNFCYHCGKDWKCGHICQMNPDNGTTNPDNSCDFMFRPITQMNPDNGNIMFFGVAYTILTVCFCCLILGNSLGFWEFRLSYARFDYIGVVLLLCSLYVSYTFVARQLERMVQHR